MTSMMLMAAVLFQSIPAGAISGYYYSLSIIAGTGVSGAPTVPGAATASSLSGPGGVATDIAGNVYIADSGNNVIEKIDYSGNLTVIAGNGTPGMASNGVATSTQLNAPCGVAADSSGNIYIADTGNNLIEKVDSSGNLTIIAGNGTPGMASNGVATSTQLNAPCGVAADSSGNIYIADTGNNLIEKVDSSGNLTIIAGNGTPGMASNGSVATASSLFNPSGIAVDLIGEVYIADSGNNLIEQIDSLGNLVFIAGTGASGSPTPGAATSSDLSVPSGVSIDGSGNVYIADSLNSVIEEVTPNVTPGQPGSLSIILGTGSIGLPTPGISTFSALGNPVAVAASGGGNVYVADEGNNMVEKLTKTAMTSPDSPTSVVANSGDSQAAISWTAPFSGGTPITSYTATISPGGLTCTTSTTSCSVSGLTNGTTYSITVTATNGIGTSAPSAPVSVVPGGIPLTAPSAGGVPTTTPSPLAFTGAEVSVATGVALLLFGFAVGLFLISHRRRVVSEK